MTEKKEKLWWHYDPEQRARQIEQAIEWRTQLSPIGKALAEILADNGSTKAETGGFVVNKPLSIGKKDE